MYALRPVSAEERSRRGSVVYRTTACSIRSSAVDLSDTSVVILSLPAGGAIVPLVDGFRTSLVLLSSI